MAPTKTKSWVLAKHLTGLPVLSGPDANFKLVERDLPALGDNQILVKTLYFSNDPAQRTWLYSNVPEDRHYAQATQLGEPVGAIGLAEVIESTSPDHPKGSIITSRINWNEYAVLDANTVRPMAPVEGVKLSQYLGALGGTGLTAYYGLVVIAGAKAGDHVVVSGAAGATGNMVVQIAKNMVGCKTVIGIAGSDEKCRWVESLGADKCLNYKSKDFEEQLKQYGRNCDIYFDNVGGSILDSMLAKVKQGGVIAACGAISGYNSDEPTILKNYMQIVMMRLQVRGFIVTDFLGKARETIQLFGEAIKQGKLKIDDKSEQVMEVPFEDVPKVWVKLFEGGNTGKLVTKL